MDHLDSSRYRAASPHLQDPNELGFCTYHYQVTFQKKDDGLVISFVRICECAMAPDSNSDSNFAAI